MPSSYSNLNFLDRADRRRWAKACEDARKVARTWPAYNVKMILCQEYARYLGPWRIIFCLQTFMPKPSWMGSASIVEHVADKRIVIPDGKYKGGYFDAPDDEYLPLKQWEKEHFEQAEFLLAEMFGELIRPGDNSQRCDRAELDHVLLWAVPYEGPQYWLQAQV